MDPITAETNIVFVVNAYGTFISIFVFFSGLLALVWKAKADLRETMDALLEPIRVDIREIRAHLSDHDRTLGILEGKYGEAKSPMRPSAEGDRLLRESGFMERAYPVLKDRLFAVIDEAGARTLYDAQVNALNSLNLLRNDPAMDVVKDYVINHPAESLELVFTVASWRIRDDYWTSRHKPSEIEKPPR